MPNRKNMTCLTTNGTLLAAAFLSLSALGGNTPSESVGSACEKTHMASLIGPDDYPIHLLQAFSGFKVKVEQIPHNSTAFKIWRSYSKPWVPDSEFLWHFYTPRQQLEAVGYLVTISVKGTHLELFRYSKAAQDMLASLDWTKQEVAVAKPNARTSYNLSKLAAPYSSISQKLAAEDISLVLDEKMISTIDRKTPNFSGVRYVVSTAGKIYVTQAHPHWTHNLIHADLSSLISILEHQNLPMEFIDAGYITVHPNDRWHLESYCCRRSRPVGSFDIVAYLKAAFPTTLGSTNISCDAVM